MIDVVVVFLLLTFIDFDPVIAGDELIRSLLSTDARLTQRQICGSTNQNDFLFVDSEQIKYIICVAAQKEIEQVKYNSLVFW